MGHFATFHSAVDICLRGSRRRDRIGSGKPNFIGLHHAFVWLVCLFVTWSPTLASHVNTAEGGIGDRQEWQLIDKV